MGDDRYKKIFKRDGTLRDIYVLDTTIDDWQRAIDWLRESEYQLAFIGAFNDIAILDDIKAFFATGEITTLRIELGDCSLNCHFFQEREIEFDVDPREILSEADAQQVYDFMSQLGSILQKRVILTEENLKDDVLLRFNPVTNEMHFMI